MSALDSRITPILCVGEDGLQRKKGNTKKILKNLRFFYLKLFKILLSSFLFFDCFENFMVLLMPEM